jgi:L-cysteine desulfidase
MPWSKTRAVCCAVCVACLAIAGFMYLSSWAYTRDFHGSVEFWLFILVGLASAIGWLVARSRDQLNEKLEENRQLLTDLQGFVCDFGDRREAVGQIAASHIRQGRRLNTVE